jgi:hypothetical protein
MNHTPFAVQALLVRYQAEHHRLLGADYSMERLCEDYIQPLLEALGWDVTNRAGVRDNKKPVELFHSPAAKGDVQLCAYLLHEQSFRYWRHYLIGVCQPPLAQHAAELLTMLETILNRSSVLIETLALTDFAQITFYDNTPGSHAAGSHRRALLYVLPCRQYPAWWGDVHGWERLSFRKRDFELYAAKLKNWAGLNQDAENPSDTPAPIDA